MKYIDLHADTVTMLHYPKENLEKNKRMVTLDAMQQGETAVQCFSAFVPTGFFPKPFKDTLVWKRFNRIADKKDMLLKQHSDMLMEVTKADDIVLCTENGKTGVVFTIEDLGVIGRDADKLDIAYNRGVRIASLTWNHENTVAYPNSKKADIMNKGIKPFGFEMIEKMNEMGMVIDVSHLSDGGFWDCIKHSKQPIIATHSNSRAMTNHTRNLTDAMLKALADKGGITGLNFAPDFLSGRKDKRSLAEDMVRHILHIRKIAGSSVLALGSDFDGISGKLEIATPADMPALADVLMKGGLSQSELEDMFYNNALRVFREVWK